MKAAVKYFVALIGLTALPAFASGGGPKVAEGVNYIAIEPALVVNYGGPGKARFIKAELSLRTETGPDAMEVMHHLPLIRDRLISILSSQTEEIISTAEGKEYLRVFALAEINKALLKVEGHSVDGHDDKHGADDKHSADDKKGSDKKAEADEHKSTEPKHDEAVATEHAETTAVVLPSVADVKPVKGPASDLFFNNFVVQK